MTNSQLTQGGAAVTIPLSNSGVPSGATAPPAGNFSVWNGSTQVVPNTALGASSGATGLTVTSLQGSGTPGIASASGQLSASSSLAPATGLALLINSPNGAVTNGVFDAVAGAATSPPPPPPPPPANQVPDFSFVATPNGPFLENAMGEINFAIASLNGFHGTINITLAPPPAGILRYYMQATQGGEQCVFLGVAGTYSLTFTATSGSLSHSVTVPITVSTAAQLAVGVAQL